MSFLWCVGKFPLALVQFTLQFLWSPFSLVCFDMDLGFFYFCLCLIRLALERSFPGVYVLFWVVFSCLKPGS